MNVYDSEKITEVAQAHGYSCATSAKEADWVILNTCHIREKAAEKVYSDLGRLRVLRDEQRELGRNMRVVVAGCVAQAQGEEILRRAPVVSIVVGPQSFHRLAPLMRQVESGGGPFCDLEFPAEEKFSRLAEISQSLKNDSSSRNSHESYSDDIKNVHTVIPKARVGFTSVALPAQLKPAPSKPYVSSKVPQRLRGTGSTSGISSVGLNKTPQISRFLTIQEGCDKFCSFCVVPYTRGAEYSRSPQAILDEAAKLADQGAREITLLGQNVNAWQHNASDRRWRLDDLLFAMAEIEGILRLRYTTSHPRDMDDALIAAHRDIPKVMPSLHLPVQSGSDRVLKLMNRRHNRDYYIDQITKIREARPDIAISSDFIVGFPGETEEDFEQTMSLVRQVTYAKAFSFCYSPRAGTPAAIAENQVETPIQKHRLTRLQELLNCQQLSFNDKLLGTSQSILFERPSRGDGQIQGKTIYSQTVRASGEASLIGQTITTKIVGSGTNSLLGRIVD